MLKGKTPVIENISRLEKFYKYLNYEVSSSTLLFAIYFMPIFIELLILATIIFTPFMLYVLFKEAKYGWVTSFIVIVLLPILILLVFAFQYNFLALLPFYFYCFLIRFETKDWLREKRARNDLALQKIKQANKGIEMDNWVVQK